jgi:rhodanese-related sulfurtransferase
VNIPLQQIAQRAGEIGPRDRAVVLYCRSGRRSAQAAEILAERGFSAVHDAGAMKDW